MIQKRINLCFDIEDSKQKEVYDYLFRSGRRKTAVVMTALTQTVMKDAYWRSMQMDRDAQLCERFASVVRENNSKDEMSELKKSIDELRAKLDNMNVVQVSGNDGQAAAPAPDAAQAAPAKRDEPEMSEDAFAAMMSFI